MSRSLIFRCCFFLVVSFWLSELDHCMNSPLLSCGWRRKSTGRGTLRGNLLVAIWIFLCGSPPRCLSAFQSRGWLLFLFLSLSLSRSETIKWPGIALGLTVHKVRPRGCGHHLSGPPPHPQSPPPPPKHVQIADRARCGLQDYVTSEKSSL